MCASPKYLGVARLAVHTVAEVVGFNEADSHNVTLAVVEALTQVRGIGRWTAQMFLIFQLGRRDVLPVDDLGLRNAVKCAYDLDFPPTADLLREMGESWRPYRSVASWYLWRSLEVG